jgi:hypothetical protein
MLIAQKKRKENIAEYILYLYQVEDLIRAFSLDMDLINNKLVKSYKADEKTAAEISAWYKNLVVMMEKEGRQETGHLQFLQNLTDDLNEFHLKLLESEVVAKYSTQFKPVAGMINELRLKNPSNTGDVQVAMDGIYGYLILKIKQQEISEETHQAVKSMSQWLAHLSKLYKDYEAGDLQL